MQPRVKISEVMGLIKTGPSSCFRIVLELLFAKSPLRLTENCILIILKSMKKNNKKCSRTDRVETTALRSPTLSKTAVGTIALLIALGTFIVYLPALWNGFINWDDDVYVYENQNIDSLNLNSLKWIFFAKIGGLWHPLTIFSLSLDHAVWGANPWGYHLTNIIIHSLNALLVFILSIRLIEYNKAINKKWNVLIPAVAASLLFGIHPVHVESVAWISERKDVLSAFFFLLTLLTYVKYVSSQGSKKSRFYVLSLLSYLFALMSKPMAVSLPVVLLILDYCPLKRLTKVVEIKNVKSIIGEKIPFFILSFLTALITIWAHHSSKALPTLERYSLMERLLTATHSYIFYLIKMIIPLSLAPFYPYPAKTDFITLEYVGFFILFLIITISTIGFLKNKNNLFPAVWLYYLFTLIPVIGIIQVGRQAAADRYTYLPSLGPFLLAGLGLGYLFERYSKKTYRITIIATGVLLVGVLANKTVNQVALWHDSITLWSHEIRYFPDAQLAYHNRGEAFDSAGDYRKAIEDYNSAIELNPKDPETYNNRGNAFASIGNYPQAFEGYSKAIELNPQYARAFYNRGNTYLYISNYRQAIEDYSRAIELNPIDPQAYNNRGNAFDSIGNYPQAIEDYSKAIELNPQYAQAFYNRGNTYLYIKKHRQAIKDFGRAIELNPLDPQAYNNRGNAFASIGNYSQAIEDYSKTIKLNPQDARAYYNLGSIYVRLGNNEQGFFNHQKAANLGLKEAIDSLNAQGVAWK